MKFQMFLRRAFLSLSLLLFASLALAQSGTGTLRGQVTDPSGAIVTNADVVMTPANGSPITTQTNSQGMYEFKNLSPGEYTLNVVAPGFALYENHKVVIADQPLRLNIPMTIEVQEQKVQVSDTAPTIDVNPSSNAGATVISGKERFLFRKCRAPQHQRHHRGQCADAGPVHSPAAVDNRIDPEPPPSHQHQSAAGLRSEQEQHADCQIPVLPRLRQQ